MSFYDIISSYNDFDPADIPAFKSDNHLDRILNKPPVSSDDFLYLLSSNARPYLEKLAQKAHQLTIQYFGKTIALFTPMYLSNFCINQCLYCGFNTKNKIDRHQLTLDEVEEEARAIARTGLKDILILTGDARKIATISYIKKCVKILKKYFTSIAIEIYALETDEYKALIDVGVNSLSIYQETYNQKLYPQLHIKGPKSDYKFRLEAPERACKAGIRGVNLGALLGLDLWQRDVFFTGLHAKYLQHEYPEVDISISLPRLRPHAGDFMPKYIVNNTDLVQIMVAFRIFLPRAGITITTREDAKFRNNLLRLGATKMSAGSTTRVGGHTIGENNTGQFDISDKRNVVEMEASIKRMGYQPVFKDWQPIL